MAVRRERKRLDQVVAEPMSPEWIRACPLIDQLKAALAGRHSLQLDIGCCGAGTMFLGEVLKHGR